MIAGSTAVYNTGMLPTGSSWLNLVDRWFAEITRKRIRRGAFRSVREPEKACRACSSSPKCASNVSRLCRSAPHVPWFALTKAQAREAERPKGKYLRCTSDDTLSAEDVALGYKQLIEVEDAFRTLKHTLDLRPVYHRVEERIRAYVLLCWLALLLVRIIERRTEARWPQIRRILQRMHLGEFAGPEGAVWQRTETTTDQHRLFTALRLPEPPRIFALPPARARARAL